MNIRHYRESDSEDHIEILNESIRGIASADYSEEEIEAWANNDPQDVKLEESRVRFIAQENGEVIGFSEYDEEMEELTGLYVKPGFTGQRVGKKLLEKAERHAKKSNIEKLSCTSTITAKKFYQRNGYEILEETTHEMNDQDLKVYIMEKEL